MVHACSLVCCALCGAVAVVTCVGAASRACQDAVDIAENIELIAPATSRLRQETNLAETIRKAEETRRRAASAGRTKGGKGGRAAAGAGAAADMDE